MGAGRDVDVAQARWLGPACVVWDNVGAGMNMLMGVRKG